MPYLETVQELLEAKEGEHVQFKEAKNRFDFGEAAKCCCALANNGGGKLVFGITDKRPRSVAGSAAFDQPERTRMGFGFMEAFMGDVGGVSEVGVGATITMW